MSRGVDLSGDGERLERCARGLEEAAERAGFQAQIDAYHDGAAFLRDLATRLSPERDRETACENCGGHGRPGENCPKCAIGSPENSSGETDRQRADRLEVECAALEDANRSLAKMRDAALEGNLAVADKPQGESSSGEEGLRERLLSEPAQRAAEAAVQEAQRLPATNAAVIALAVVTAALDATTQEPQDEERTWSNDETLTGKELVEAAKEELAKRDAPQDEEER